MIGLPYRIRAHSAIRQRLTASDLAPAREPLFFLVETLSQTRHDHKPCYPTRTVRFDVWPPQWGPFFFGGRIGDGRTGHRCWSPTAVRWKSSPTDGLRALAGLPLLKST